MIILISDKVNFRGEKITRDRHYIMIKNQSSKKMWQS